MTATIQEPDAITRLAVDRLNKRHAVEIVRQIGIGMYAKTGDTWPSRGMIWIAHLKSRAMVSTSKAALSTARLPREPWLQTGVIWHERPDDEIQIMRAVEFK